MLDLIEKTKSEISNTNLTLSGDVYIGTAETKGPGDTLSLTKK